MAVTLGQMKYPTILLIFIVVAASTYFSFKSPSYKAKTVDECVRERDCVWYAFSRLADFKTMPDGSIRLISKWGRDIQIVAIDDKDGRGVQKIQDAIDLIQPHIPYKISIEKKFNFLILFSDDIVNDVLYKYRDEFRKTFGSDIMEQKMIASGLKNSHCFSTVFHSSDEGYLWFGVIISNREDQISGWCIRNALTSAIAFEKPLKNFPFSVANFPEIKGQEPTKLDFMLMDILYDPRFDQMESMGQIELVFDAAYNKLLPIYQN